MSLLATARYGLRLDCRITLHFGLVGSGVAALVGGVCGKDRFITLGPTNATAVLSLGFYFMRNDY